MCPPAPPAQPCWCPGPSCIPCLAAALLSGRSMPLPTCMRWALCSCLVRLAEAHSRPTPSVPVPFPLEFDMQGAFKSWLHGLASFRVTLSAEAARKALRFDEVRTRAGEQLMAGRAVACGGEAQPAPPSCLPSPFPYPICFAARLYTLAHCGAVSAVGTVWWSRSSTCGDALYCVHVCISSAQRQAVAVPALLA